MTTTNLPLKSQKANGADFYRRCLDGCLLLTSQEIAMRFPYCPKSPNYPETLPKSFPVVLYRIVRDLFRWGQDARFALFYVCVPPIPGHLSSAESDSSHLPSPLSNPLPIRLILSYYRIFVKRQISCALRAKFFIKKFVPGLFDLESFVKSLVACFVKHLHIYTCMLKYLGVSLQQAAKASYNSKLEIIKSEMVVLNYENSGFKISRRSSFRNRQSHLADQKSDHKIDYNSNYRQCNRVCVYIWPRPDV